MADPNPLPSTRHLLTSLITTIASSTQQNQSDTSNPLSSTATSQNTKSAFLTLHSLFPNDFLPALDLLDRGLVTRCVLAEKSKETKQSSEVEAVESILDGDDVHGGQNEDNQSIRERRGTDIIQNENRSPNQIQTEQRTKRNRKPTVVYQVRSAQRTKNSSRSDQPTATGTSYEVRLKAWNCSCPAFAFAALPVGGAASSSPASPSREEVEENGHRDGGIGRDEHDGAGYGVDRNRPASTGHDGEDGIAWLGFGGLTRGEDVPACKHLLACVVAERCQGFEQLVEEKQVGMEEIAGWAAGWGD